MERNMKKTYFGLCIYMWCYCVVQTDEKNSCTNQTCGCCKPHNCYLNGFCAECAEEFTGPNCTAHCRASCRSCSRRYLEGDRRCDTCKDGYYNGKYQDIAENTARDDCSLQCTDGCKSCKTFKICIKCKVGYFLSASYQCIKCPEYCEICSSTNLCDKCVIGKFWNGSECMFCGSNCISCSSYEFCTVCESGFYLSGHSCKVCPSNCLSCDDTSACHTCQTGYHINYGRCVECDQKCIHCDADKVVSYDCSICDYRYNLISPCYQCGNFCSRCHVNGSCEMCIGTYNLIDGLCYKCNPVCKSCATSGNCTACQSGFYDFGADCIPCPDNCLDCISEKACDKCQQGFYGQDCALRCPENCYACDKVTGWCSSCLMGNYVNESGYCRKCPQHCLSCQSERFCDSCEDGFKGSTCRCPKSCECSDEEFCLFCENGFTGFACDRKCSQGCAGKICSRKTGECLNGCVAGYVGTHCVKGDISTETDTSSPSSMHLVVISVGLIILGAAIVFFGITSVVCVLLYRRKRGARIETTDVEQRKQRSKGKRNTTPSNLIELDDYMETKFSKKSEKQRGDNVPLLQIRRIAVSEFADYLSSKQETDFISEFEELPSSLTKPYKESQKKGNVRKNRYKGIYPYDETRVVLETGDSNYINATFIDGYNQRKAYIASIGPTENYMGDMSTFWRMVWQEGVGKIVMLCGLSEAKVNTCDQYWPDKDYISRYGEFTVTSLKEEIYPSYTRRYFEIQLKSERRAAIQFQFTSWPEHDEPFDVTSLITFHNEVKETNSDLEGPVIVHCSAGIGRTGTYIALDILSREGEADGFVDVFACVKKLREQRIKMVQTVEQYKFLHEALVCSLNYYTQILNDSPTNAEASAAM